MKCERARELFSEYMEGSIDYALTATVQGHIERCTTCGRDFEMFRRTWNMLDSLPQVQPPANFRHDVVMRAARMQHVCTQTTRKRARRIDWGALLSPFCPARALAVASAGALLAVVLLGLPRSAYDAYKGAVIPGVSIPKSQHRDAAQADPVSPLSSLESGCRLEWQSRKLQRNTVWVTVNPTGDPSLYQIVLTINRKALLPGVSTERIGAKIRLLSANQPSEAAESNSTLYWQGSLIADSPVLVPLIVDRSQGRTVLVSWRFHRRSFAQVVFLPSQKPSAPSGSVFDFSVNSSNLGGGASDVYSVLRAISNAYGVPIVANAYLDAKPPVVNPDEGSVEQTLMKALKPAGLDWMSADSAIYIDREYNVADPE